MKHNQRCSKCRRRVTNNKLCKLHNMHVEKQQRKYQTSLRKQSNKHLLDALVVISFLGALALTYMKFKV